MPRAPRQVNDGNWKLESQLGCDAVSHPFSNRGDHKTAEIKRKMQVDHRFLKSMAPMSQINTPYGKMYLVEQGDTSQVANGIVEFTRTFSTVPAPRLEYGQIGYTRQEFTGTAIVEFTETVPCVIAWEYSLSPLKQLLAPRIVAIGSTFKTFGDWGTFAVGQQYLAEDSLNDIYKSKIYFRNSIYITWKALTLIE